MKRRLLWLLLTVFIMVMRLIHTYVLYNRYTRDVSGFCLGFNFEVIFVDGVRIIIVSHSTAGNKNGFADFAFATTVLLLLKT